MGIKFVCRRVRKAGKVSAWKLEARFPEPLPDPDGRKSITRKFEGKPTSEQRAQFERQAEQLLSDGRKQTALQVDIAFHDFGLAQYLDFRRSDEIAASPQTIAADRNAVAQFTREIGTELPLRNLTPEHCLDARASWRARSLSQGTIASYWSACRSVLSYAQERGLVESNPFVVAEARMAHRPRRRADKTRQADPSVPSLDEVRRLRAYFDRVWSAPCSATLRDLGDALTWQLMLECSLRPGEAAGLTFEDLAVDGPTPSVSIRYSLAQKTGPDGKLLRYLRPAKTGSSVRTMPISEATAARLLAWLRLRREIETADLVFVLKSGRPVNLRFRSLLQALGIEANGRSQKVLRKVIPTHVQGRAGLGSIAKWLGHSGTAVAARHYVGALDAHVGEIAQQFESVLAG